MKRKKWLMPVLTIVLLLIAALVTSYADSARVRNSVEPVHTIKIVSEDGCKVTYWGLGYKVIRYPSVSPNEPYKNNRGVKYGSWFMEYEPPVEENSHNRVWHTDFEGVYVQVHEVSNDPVKSTMVVSWNNETAHTVTYGEIFWIERLVDGEWVDCSLKENPFITIGHLLDVNISVLSANTSAKKEYSLTDMYDVSKPGTYRFCSTCNVEVAGEQPAACSLWTEFVVE